MATVFELQKRIIPSTRWRHIGYFQSRKEALTEQHLPIGVLYLADWRILEHDAFLNPDTPERAILMSQKEVSLGRTVWFV